MLELMNMNTKSRVVAIFSGMGIGLSLLVYDAYFNPGWLGAFVWGMALSAVYYLFAAWKRDELFGRWLLFAFSASLCRIWNLHEPAVLEPFRSHDKKRFDQGLPWQDAFEGIEHVISKLRHLFDKKPQASL